MRFKPALTDKAALAGADEVEDILDFGTHGNLVLHALQQVVELACILQDDAVSLVDIVDKFTAEATTTQSHHVQTAEAGGISGYQTEGENVLAEACTTAYHAVAAYSAELVHEHRSAENSLVIDDNLACQLGAVAYDALITYLSVVSHVCSLHQEIVAAHHSLALGSCSAVDSHVLTNLVVVAYLGSCILTPELQILGNSADDSAGEEDVSVADACSIEHRHTVHQRVVVAYHHTFVDVAESTNLAILAYPCLWVDVGQWTDFTHRCSTPACPIGEEPHSKWGFLCG